MKNLDPRLLVLWEEARQREQERTLAGAVAGVDEAEIFVHFTGPLADLTACGLKNAVTAEAPGEPTIAAGTLPLNRLKDITAVPHVRWIDPHNPLSPTLDVSLSEIGARNASVTLQEKGRGVIVGMVDDGLDYLHPAFRDPSNSKKSRILSFWDQMGTGGPVPAGFDNLGVEYDRAAIEQLLTAESPPWTRGFHGTHVAAIALGNGQVSGDPNPVPGKYIGVAPEAELICVGVPTHDVMPPQRTRRMGHYHDTHVSRGFKYIFDKAKALQRPVVINLSMGYSLGPRDGTSPLEKMIDRWIAQEPAGRIVVVAAGNDGNRKACHAEGTVPAGGHASVEINLSREHNSMDQRYSLDLWYQGPALLSVQVDAPPEKKGDPRQVSNEVHPGPPTIGWPANPSAPADERTKVNIYSYEKHEWNGCHRIFVEIITPKKRRGPEGPWYLVLKNLGSAEVPFDVWCDGPPFTRYCPRKTLSTPSTAKNVITVGAYLARTDLLPPYDRLSPQPEDQSEVAGSIPLCTEGAKAKVSGQGPAKFSLRGPSRDGGPKPEITAPGVSIYSALGRPLVPPGCCETNEEYGAKDGTSMAAPMVAGVIALMLERNPALTHQQVRKALIDTARRPTDVSVWPDSRWGYGKLNAAAAVTTIQKVPAPAPVPPTPLAKEPASAPRSARSVSASRVRSAEPRKARFLDRESLRALRDALAATPAGQRWGTLMTTHSAEVYTLVNRNRSVTVTWHRNGGPQLVQAFLTSIQNLERPLPTEVNGRPAAMAVESILAVLRQHGSPELAADIDRYRDELLRLPGASFHQLLERLRATP
jgi:subtilisin family serine protease